MNFKDLDRGVKLRSIHNPEFTPTVVRVVRGSGDVKDAKITLIATENGVEYQNTSTYGRIREMYKLAHM